MSNSPQIGMSVADLSSIPIAAIEAARAIQDGNVYHTPLVPLNHTVDRKRIYLKLENLQPVGSFKIRGAYNALKNIPPEQLQDGVFTASAGNFAQGLACSAREMGIPCTVIVPDTAPKIKTDAIRQYGAKIVPISFEKWWEVMTSFSYPGLEGRFIHPVAEKDVIAGNGTIGLELIEDLDHIDAVVCPFGGGGLISGIASALKVKSPHTRVYACEVDVAAPLKASLDAGNPAVVRDHTPNFVDGMSGKSLFPEMWNMVRNLVCDTIPLPVEQIAEAVRLLVSKNHIVAEGAGAATVAAALSGHAGDGNIVCVVSGGNIDARKLGQILQGQVPT